MEGAPRAERESKRYGEIPNNPYDALGVTPNNTKQEIKRAWKESAKKYHPDVNPKDKEAEAWSKAINVAYDVITNPQYKPSIRPGKNSFFSGWSRPNGPAYRQDDINDNLRKRQKKAEEDRKREQEARMDQSRRERQAADEAERVRREQEANAEAERVRREEEERIENERKQKEAEENTKREQEERERQEQEKQEKEGRETEEDAGSTSGVGEETAGDESSQTSPEEEPKKREKGSKRKRKKEAKKRQQESQNTREKTEEESEVNSSEQGPEENNGGGTENSESTAEEASGAENQERDFDAELASARSVYASEYIGWKNANREKKGRIAKLASSLGFEKEIPEAEIPQIVKDAQNAYIEAKKRKNAGIFNRSETLTGVEGDFEFNSDLLAEAEKEYAALQEKIAESLPPLEKGILEKGFEKWSKLSPMKRRVISTALLTAGAWATGGVGLGALLTYSTYKFARSTASAGIAQGAGKLTETVFKRTNKKTREKNSLEYGTNINMDNFEAKERTLMQTLDKEKDKLKRQRLYKAGVMVAAGGIATAGIGNAYGSIAETPPIDNVNTGGSIHDKVDAFHDKLKSIHKGEHLSDEFGVKPNVSNDVLETKVELSSKGFIDDFVNLKAKLVEQYGGEGNVPSQYEHIMKTSPTNLAQKFGFYDPEQNASGLGFKGETLGVDENGDLVYQHLDGTKDVMFDAKTGVVNEFDGKMVTPKAAAEPEVVSEEVVTEENTQPVSSPDSTESMTAEQISDTPPLTETPAETVAPEAGDATDVVEGEVGSVGRIPYKDSFMSVVDRGGSKVITFNGTEIAHDHMFGSGERMILDPQFMEGSQYAEIRKAFSVAFGSRAENWNNTKGLLTQSFEGGRIDFVSNLGSNKENISVLLNGREMAKGVMTSTGLKLDILGNLKGGWFSADTVYERAFKQIKDGIKGNIKIILENNK